MDLGLNGKYALVTGGSHGIGRSIALALAEEGCNVAICARKKGWIEHTIAEVKTKGVEAIGIAADVLVLEDIDLVMETVINSQEMLSESCSMFSLKPNLRLFLEYFHAY